MITGHFTATSFYLLLGYLLLISYFDLVSCVLIILCVILAAVTKCPSGMNNILKKVEIGAWLTHSRPKQATVK